MEKKEFRLESADGHKIPVLHFLSGAKNLLIASHGITSEKTEEDIYTSFAKSSLPPEFDMLVFDFRGHGESSMSSQDVTIAGEILDLMAVFRWAKGQKYESVCHLATSFGSSITLLAASVYDLSFLSKVVFWNPVISYFNTFIDAKVEWGKEFFNQNNFEELSIRPFTSIPETDFKISAIMTQEMLFMAPEKTKWPQDLPLLIIHGDNDTLVPYDDAVDYSRQNNSKTEFIGLKGVDHGFDHKIDQAMALTKEWLLKEI